MLRPAQQHENMIKMLFHVIIVAYLYSLYICMQVETSKKKVKKTNVPLAELVYGAITAEDLQKAVEKEFEMALQDRVMEETKDKKNAVEAYVYDMRNKVFKIFFMLLLSCQCIWIVPVF